MQAKLIFEDKKYGYNFTLVKGSDTLIFQYEGFLFGGKDFKQERFKEESALKTSTGVKEAQGILEYLKGLKKYHFHDTGKNSPFNKTSHILNDTYFLYEKGDNLAAFLYDIQAKYPIVYNRIIKTVQSIAPYFSDFYFQPNTEGYLRLLWQDKYSSTVYSATDLSDGTIRFIALAALFLQPNLPQTIIIDEPELGLHPFALSKLAGMIKSAAAKGSQVIVATQSTDLLSYFEPDDIIAVDQKEGASVFNRLKQQELDIWLNDYSLGELWKRNIITEGQP